MLAAKRQLEVDIENLEARKKMVEVAQTTSNYQFDDSQLGQVKELVTDLRTRLRSGREDGQRREQPARRDSARYSDTGQYR